MLPSHVQKSAVTEYYTEHNFTYTGEVIFYGPSMELSVTIAITFATSKFVKM